MEPNNEPMNTPDMPANSPAQEPVMTQPTTSPMSTSPTPSPVTTQPVVKMTQMNEETSTPKEPTTPASSTPPINEEPKSAGPIVGSIIIIVIIIIGGLYFWGQRLTETDPTLSGPTAEEIAAEEDTELMNLQKQSSSDAIADIESDLNATNLESLDTELDNIDLSF